MPEQLKKRFRLGIQACVADISEIIIIMKNKLIISQSEIFDVKFEKKLQGHLTSLISQWIGILARLVLFQDLNDMISVPAPGRLPSNPTLFCKK